MSSALQRSSSIPDSLDKFVSSSRRNSSDSTAVANATLQNTNNSAVSALSISSSSFPITSTSSQVPGNTQPGSSNSYLSTILLIGSVALAGLAIYFYDGLTTYLADAGRHMLAVAIPIITANPLAASIAAGVIILLIAGTILFYVYESNQNAATKPQHPNLEANNTSKPVPNTIEKKNEQDSGISTGTALKISFVGVPSIFALGVYYAKTAGELFTLTSAYVLANPYAVGGTFGGGLLALFLGTMAWQWHNSNPDVPPSITPNTTTITTISNHNNSVNNSAATSSSSTPDRSSPAGSSSQDGSQHGITTFVSSSSSNSSSRTTPDDTLNSYVPPSIPKRKVNALYTATSLVVDPSKNPVHELAGLVSQLNGSESQQQQPSSIVDQAEKLGSNLIKQGARAAEASLTNVVQAAVASVGGVVNELNNSTFSIDPNWQPGTSVSVNNVFQALGAGIATDNMNINQSIDDVQNGLNIANEGLQGKKSQVRDALAIPAFEAFGISAYTDQIADTLVKGPGSIVEDVLLQAQTHLDQFKKAAGTFNTQTQQPSGSSSSRIHPPGDIDVD